MTDWFIVGNHWILCRVMTNVFGSATVMTHDGQRLTGKARRGLYGLLVEPVS